jgi:hypothetical protein
MPWLAICNYLTPDGVIVIVVIPPITWQVVEICGRYINECEDIEFLEQVKVADIMISTNKIFGNVMQELHHPPSEGANSRIQEQDTGYSGSELDHPPLEGAQGEVSSTGQLSTTENNLLRGN